MKTAKLWPLLILTGAGMLTFAFFMPWWGVTVSSPGLPKKPEGSFRDSDYKDKMEKYRDEIEKFVKKMKKDKDIREKSEKWYEAMNVDEKMDDEMDELKDEIKEGKSWSATVRLWGWNTGTGLTNFIFGLIILPLAILPMFIGVVRNWRFIGSCIAAVLGLIGLIFGMVFYFGSPGENGEFFSQGVGLSPGPPWHS